MNMLPDLAQQQFALFLLPPRAEGIQELLGRLALRGPVRVIDGGNSIDAFWLSRYIRRHTVQVEDILRNITFARSFTCYQMQTQLRETLEADMPTVVLHMLTNFYDENVELKERLRVLTHCINELYRLRSRSVVAAVVRPDKITDQPDRIALLEHLRESADVTYYTEPPQVIEQLSMF